MCRRIFRDTDKDRDRGPPGVRRARAGMGRQAHAVSDKKEGDMDKEIIEIPGLSDAIRKVGVPLSICVKAGDLLFVSGLPPLDPAAGKMVQGGVAEQTEQVLKNIQHTLETAGSSLDRVVKCTVYITNAAYFSTVNEIYGRYFPNDPPARTFATVGSWPWEFDIEIECTALCDE